jgi:uncharacterized protein YlzI (FlbEa/FlbD family)
MSNLIKFLKGDGTPVLINPDFIQEVICLPKFVS